MTDQCIVCVQDLAESALSWLKVCNSCLNIRPYHLGILPIPTQCLGLMRVDIYRGERAEK